MEHHTDFRTEQPILLITGMHRSGTSFVAGLLQSAGLDIGTNLLEANYSNPKGFFENTDFLDFHRSVLSSLGIEPKGWIVPDEIIVPDEYVSKAKQLIKDNASAVKPWGWKEPRTTIFLNFWSNLLPNAKFLFIYRSPWEVIDSLYRRGDRPFYDVPEFALEIWTAYNQKIIDFCLQYPEKCLLVNLNSLTNNSQTLIKTIQEKFSIVLDYPDLAFYEPSLLKKSDSAHSYIIKYFFPKAFNLYHQLNQIADLTTDEVQLDPNVIPDRFLKDWVEMRFWKRKAQTAQTEIEELRSQIIKLQTDM